MAKKLAVKESAVEEDNARVRKISGRSQTDSTHR